MFGGDRYAATHKGLSAAASLAWEAQPEALEFLRALVKGATTASGSSSLLRCLTASIGVIVACLAVAGQGLRESVEVELVGAVGLVTAAIALPIELLAEAPIGRTEAFVAAIPGA